MSYAIKVARASYQGDPGLFGFIGKALGTVARVAGGILPGPAGTIARAVGGALAPASTAVMRPSSQVLVSSVRPGFVQTAGGIPAPQLTLPGGRQLSLQGTTIVSGPTSAAGQTGPVRGPLLGGRPQTATCERGYHYNRTGYQTKRYGWVEAGTVCVKNRKRNPLNPKALSRALARTASARKAIKALKIFQQVRPRTAPAAGKKCTCR